jgi:outer membrane scaffolding protein for murein synthesis (MipA/OmpV family)
MSRVRLATLAFAAILPSCIGFASADSVATGEAELEISFGAAYTADPRFYGVLIRPRWQPALEAEYSRNSYFASTEHGFGYRIADGKDLKVGIAINYQSGRKEGSDPRYKGLGSVPGAAEAYAYFEWLPWGPALTLYGEFGRALAHTRGSVYTAGARLGFPLRSGLSGFVDVSTAGGNERYLQTFYGVSPEQSLTSGHPPYAVHSGPYNGSLVLGVSLEIQPKWNLIAGAGAMRYFGSVAASPLVGRRSYPIGLLVSSHDF